VSIELIVWKRLEECGTFQVRVGLNSSKYIDMLLDDVVIRNLESIKRRIQSRVKDTVYALQEKEHIHACMLLGGFDDQDPNDWDDEECRTARDVNIPVAILCSSDSDDEQDLSSMTKNTSSTGAVLSVPAATLCSSDGSEEEDDEEDSEEFDSADTGPSGECLTKRGAPVTTSGGEGREEKPRIRMRERMDVFDSKEMRWASCCGVSFC
jgi:hypothetical protein